jgi:hypothetical protein
MTSISHVEHRNGTSVAQDSVLADEGGAFAFDIEVDVNKVDLETSGVQKGLTLRIVIVPRETNDRSYDWDNRRHNVSPGSTLDQTTGVAGVDDMMDFLLDSTCMGCESVQPVQSILKAPRSWILGEEEKVGKDYREERAVEFKTVVIREFGMTLGDHPNAISGPPVRIDWDEADNRGEAERTCSFPYQIDIVFWSKNGDTPSTRLKGLGKKHWRSGHNEKKLCHKPQCRANGKKYTRVYAGSILA